MDFGKQIYEMRKKANLSQEQLAEKVGVSRQTISKWELGETAPDIKQAQKLSQIFNVSLDELTGNDTKEVIYEKVSNTERLAGIVINILKVIGILIIISVIATLISIIVLAGLRQNVNIKHELKGIVITENIGEQQYIINIADDGSFNSEGLTDEMKEDIISLIDFDNLDMTAENIKKYFIKLREELKNPLKADT